MIYIDLKIDLNTAAGKKEANYKLHIEKDEFITLFGVSGSGKTTLLRLIAGLEDPKEGKIIVDGEVWFDSDKKINLPPQKRSVGFVFQDYALFPTMSVKQNLLFASKNEEQKTKIPKLLSIVELEKLASSLPNQLSGGQKQRVALARALACEPKILLLDEPLSALDNAMRLKLQEELLAVHKEFNVTVILVSHDIGEAIKLSDRVAVIEEGKIIAIDKPVNIFSSNNGSAKIYGEVIETNQEGFYLLVGQNIIFINKNSNSGKEYILGEVIECEITQAIKE